LSFFELKIDGWLTALTEKGRKIMKPEYKKKRKKVAKKWMAEGWQNFQKTKPTKAELVEFIQKVSWSPLVIEAFKVFLKRKDLDFGDCLALIETIQQLKGCFKRRFWKRCFSLASADDWFEVIRYYQDQSEIREIFWKGFQESVQKGVIPRETARKILIRIFSEVPREEIRKKVWVFLKTLEPKEENVRAIADVEVVSNSLIGLCCDVREQLEKFKREKAIADQRLDFLRQLIARINQAVKER